MSLKSCSVLLSGLLLWNLATLPARAESYQWPSQIPSPLKAPTDRSTGRLVKGAALQGGLLDLRFGQASVDVQGVGHILDWNNLSKFTLDGRACDAKALEKAVKDGEGLSVAVRYNPESGLIGWMDAVSGRPQASVVTRLSSTGILKPGDTLHVAVPASETTQTPTSLPERAWGLPTVENETSQRRFRNRDPRPCGRPVALSSALHPVGGRQNLPRLYHLHIRSSPDYYPIRAP